MAPNAYVDGTRPNETNEIVLRLRLERWYWGDFAKMS